MFLFDLLKPKSKEANNILVSLTSYPERINIVEQTIKSLLKQSLKADKIILWLAPEQFPKKEDDLPKSLLKLENKGLIIDWYKDIRSYKKLIPTLIKYPDNIIITVDDDIIYKKDCIKNLYNTYLKNKDCIVANKIDKIYNSNCLIGYGGVLYPSCCLYKDILREDLFMKLCYDNDDIWFWVMASLNNTKVIQPETPSKTKYISNSQENELCLYKKNSKNGARDEILRQLTTYYPELIEKFK